METAIGLKAGNIPEPPEGQCRVAGRCCHRPAPSEPCLRLSPHTAQALRMLTLVNTAGHIRDDSACPSRLCNMMHVIRRSRRLAPAAGAASCFQRIPVLCIIIKVIRVKDHMWKWAPLPAAVMLLAGTSSSTAIPSITDRHSLSPRSATRLPSASLAGSFPLFGTREEAGKDGLTA